MAFVRPTLADIVERVEQDFLSRLGLVEPILRRSMVYVLSRVIAGAAHLLHGHMEFLSKQIFPDISDRDYLLRWGALFGLSLTAAEYSTGYAGATGTNGTVIPAGTLLRRADGTEYSVDAEATISTGIASLAVTATVAGADGDCDASTVLTFESPIAGIDSTALVGAYGLSGGADEETTDAFRVRVLARMQTPPHGGSNADYVAWAKEVPGVTRAWCFPLEDGDGTVMVRFVRDNDANLIPDAGEVAAVLTHIIGTAPWYLDRLSPVTAVVSVEAPTAVPIDFDLSVTPSTTAVKAAVQAALEDLLLRVARPGGTIPLSQIQIAIGTADGVTDFTLTSPAADIPHDPDEMATMGTITYPV